MVAESIYATEKMSLASLVTGDILEAQYNPTEIEEEVKVNWNELDVLGLSHQPLQYKNTSNLRFKFTMRFEAIRVGQKVAPSIATVTNEGTEYIKTVKALLYSWCYGPRGAQDIPGGAPPRLLFMWPGLASLTAVMDSLLFKNTFFNRRGRPARVDAEVTIKEIRDARLFSEDVATYGAERPGFEFE